MEKVISTEDSNIILAEMCKVIGVDFESFDFSQPNWYWQHTWTKEQEEAFRVWLGEFLVKNKYTKKGNYRGQNAGYYEAGKLLFNYGWVIKNEDPK